MSNAEQPPLITECPNCHTRFRVSDNQLKIAHGRVRCGACLAVFPGMDHMLADEESDTPKPDRRRRTSTLESVLTELSEEQARNYPDEQHPPHEPGEDPVAAEVLTGYDPAIAKRDTRFEFAPEDPESAAPQAASDASDAADVAATDPALAEPSAGDDWMAVSVDTTAMDAVPAHDSEERPSFDDALNDEEALRWWLADELTGEHAIATNGDGYGDRETAEFGAGTTANGRVAAVEQLEGSEDGDESFDLEELILAAADGSAEKLEALLSELPSEMAQADKEELAAVGSSSKREKRAERAAHSQESALLEAAVPQLSIEVPANDNASDHANAEINYSDVPLVGPVPNVPERIMAAIAKRKRKAAEKAADRVSTTEQLLADGALATEEFDALDALALAEARSIAQPVVPPVSDREAVAEQPRTDVATLPQTEPQPLDDGANRLGWLGSLLSSGRSVRVGTAVASLLLVMQIFYHQFDSWVERPSLRPIYSAACTVLGCELPAQRSLGELSSRKLVVRQHPDDANLLLVDVLLVNEAEFAQPYPLLELNFMTARGEIAVTHQIAADDYLGGELRNSTALMPTLTPIHIDFVVPNPGADAPSYQLAIR